MMKKNKNRNSYKDIKLIGKTRQEISDIIGSNYTFYSDNGDVIFETKYMFFFKRRIYVGFDENGKVDTVIRL